MLLDVRVHVGSSMPCSHKTFSDAAVLHCVEWLLEVDGCDPKCLVPHGSFLSELLECVYMISVVLA